MDLAISIDPDSPTPLYRQLYEELRQSILSGRLLPRQRLPSTRALAKLLKLSRATVTLSYEQLLSEGYLEAAPGSGTHVCAQLPDDLVTAAPTESDWTIDCPAIALSRFGKALFHTDMQRLSMPDTVLSFHYGEPALDHFPLDLWRKLTLRHCRDSFDWMYYATDAGGHLPLRAAIAQYLARARAVRCSPEQVIVTNGTQQSLDLLTRLLTDPGDRVAMENPGYLGARRTFRGQGLQFYSVPVDASGLVVKRLEQAPADLKLVYITPSHQFPTGSVLSLPRRLELLAWAARTGTLIIEDDYDSEYRYVDRPIPALQGLDQHRCVFYVGTFSKVLFPSLRLGYVIVPPGLVDTFTRAKWTIDRQCSMLEQVVLTDFIQEGHLERHIRRMRLLYDERRQTLVNALNQQLGERVTILGENAGIHVMVQLKTDLSDAEVVERAAQAGVGLTSARSFYLEGGKQGEFVFGYAGLSTAQIEAGVDRLAQLLKPSAQKRRSAT